MKIQSFAVMVLAAVCLTSIPVDAAKRQKERESGTCFAKEALQPYVESGELPGAISIFFKDGVRETCCIGYSDVSARKSISTKDIFMQCSQTKGFCGVTVAKLIEEGKVSLDDPVSDYLPEFKELWVRDSTVNGVRTLHKARNVLTVRMVLNHTGGFPFEVSAKRPDVPGSSCNGGAPLRQVASIAAATQLLFEPGTDVNYSNVGIDIAGAIVEVVTGMKWDEYLKREVLDPLGMKSSCFFPTDKKLDKRVKLYRCVENSPAGYLEDLPLVQSPYNDSHVFVASSGDLWTTAEDQFKFYKMLMNLGVGDNGARILKEETVKSLMLTSSRPEEFGWYSLGLTTDENGWTGHGGALGTSCFFDCRTKSLRLWVVQLEGKPRPWMDALDKAADAFFNR